MQRIASVVAGRLSSSLPAASSGFSSASYNVAGDVQKILNAMEAAGISGDKMDPEAFAKMAVSNPDVTQAVLNLQAAGASMEAATPGAFAKPPVRVAVTGASGNIGYALLPRIASGEMLGPDQPVILQLLELPNAMDKLKGVVMELEDGAYPLLKGIVSTDKNEKAFENADFALLVGAKPRGKGMERGDLLKDNGAIFSTQGAALNKVAARNVRVVVVGNPANTNALIAAHNAPDLDPSQFSAMTRLDHNRGLAQLAAKAGVNTTDIERFAIWGNHSSTQYPDVSHATIGGKWAKDVINDEKWIRDTFIPNVQQRGAAIIKARGQSSAMSAASSAIDHIRDWMLGTNGQWTSMAVPSDGSYGCEPGVYFSQPVVCANGGFARVQDIPLDEYSAAKIEASRKELFEERDAVKALLK